MTAGARAPLLARLADDLASLRNPRTLMLGVVSGYAMTACFGVLAALALATGVLRWHWAFPALVGAKLFTNTLAWLALRTDRLALELGGLNTAMDAVVMTGAIWATGDSASPLIAIYTIEVTVLALLTNLTTAVLVGVLSLALFIAMCALTSAGVVPRFPTPAEWSGRDGVEIAIATLYAGFVIGAPTFYVAGILHRLRDNERRLEARTIALVDAGKQKAQFMANMTHELRTPLQGIMGLSDLVAKGIFGETTERQRDAMRDLKASSKRLLALIDDLLQLASHDAGKLGVKLTEVDLGELLPGVVSNAQWLLAGKLLHIELTVEPGLPAITSDRGKVNQIVLNLVSNAIKFTPEGGSLALRARRARGARGDRPERDGVVIEVDDTGVGIPAGEIDRIFDEFHQVDGSSSREYGGVGLGLALVARLLGLLGGTIEVDSTVGRGSTFRVWLPLAPGG